jgi:hypothetical protein
MSDKLTDQETTRRETTIIYDSRWSAIPAVALMAVIGVVVLIGAIGFLWVGRSPAAAIFLVAIGSLSILAAWMQWRRPQVVLTTDGIHRPNSAETIPWLDVAGVRYIDLSRHRQLHIWLNNPAEHADYVSEWVGKQCDGSAENPLVFGINSTSGSNVWPQLAKRLADSDVELIHEKSV